MTTPCPTCKGAVALPRDDRPLPPNYPFCCERCKLIDLGRWLDGAYQIPVQIDPDDDQPTGRYTPVEE